MRREQIAAALRYLENKADLKKRAERTLSLDPQPEADLGDMAVDVVGGFIPGVGQALAARDVERARRANDPAGMAMAGAGMIPGGKLAGLLKRYDPTMAHMGDVYDFRTKAKVNVDRDELPDVDPIVMEWVQNEQKGATDLLNFKDQKLIDRYIDIQRKMDREWKKMKNDDRTKYNELADELDALGDVINENLTEPGSHILFDAGSSFTNPAKFREFLNLTPEQRLRNFEREVKKKK